MRNRLLSLVFLLALLPSQACTFYSTATHWNGRVGPTGDPVYYVTLTKVGFNLLIVLPFLGHTDIDRMVRELTAHLDEEGGDIVRIVQGDTENYWFGWSPFTWIVTPVVATLAAEFQPSEALRTKVEKAISEEEESLLDIVK